MATVTGEELAEIGLKQKPNLEPNVVKALEMVSPGSQLREGIDNILLSRTGALIVVGEPKELDFLFSGGIPLDVDYSPQMLYQLAKMDGAIALNSSCTKITGANIQLTPDPNILSLETGTRHRAADRVSKQVDALVIAISQRREVVSLYAEGTKYILEDIPVVLAKANQALATLDKYRRRLDQVSSRMTLLEFEGSATLQDVLTVLKRAELVSRMALEIERYVVELGVEGRMIEMQLEETVVGVSFDKLALIRDYVVDSSDLAVGQAVEMLAKLPHQDLLDYGRLAEVLGYDRKINTADQAVSARGHRVLGRLPRLPGRVARRIVKACSGLSDIAKAGEDGRLADIEGVDVAKANEIVAGLRRVQETGLSDRYP